METPLRISFENYTIVRVPPAADGGEPLYVVRRPDGSQCCDATTWAGVEAVICRDQAAGEGQERLA